jgi:serine/threonine protein kinase
MALDPRARLGPYKVLEPLGSGGMGEVYARDHRLGRIVAIKVLRPELAVDRDRVERFEREARSASSLNHPNIVTIHDVAVEQSTSYIAMEWLMARACANARALESRSQSLTRSPSAHSSRTDSRRRMPPASSIAT